MALFQDLPNELFIMIVSFLIARKIGYFDPVATKDLQSLRLVSQTINGVATPFLFRDLVLEFSSWKLSGMKRIIRFARGNPELAKHVRRLQLRTPATTIPFVSSEWSFGPPSAEEVVELYESGFISTFGLEQRHSSRVHELVIAPLEAQWKDEVHNFDTIRRIMRETIALLPSLSHVENAVSTHEIERTATAYQKVWNEMGRDLSGYFPTVSDDQSDTLAKGVSYLLPCLPNTITSLILREVPFENRLYRHRIPIQIQHLDLELRIDHDEYGTLKDPVQTYHAVHDWRRQFSILKHLKTLRLSLSHGDTYPNSQEWLNEGGPNLYVEDLLTGIQISAARLETIKPSTKKKPI